jgi:hypothetical protein
VNRSQSYDNSHFLKDSVKGGGARLGQPTSEKYRQIDHNSWRSFLRRMLRLLIKPWEKPSNEAA